MRWSCIKNRLTVCSALSAQYRCVTDIVLQGLIEDLLRDVCSTTNSLITIASIIKEYMAQRSNVRPPKAAAPLRGPRHARMWANAQRDGRPAEHRWLPLFNAAKFG